MDELIAFLKARLDEREALIRRLAVTAPRPPTCVQRVLDDTPHAAWFPITPDQAAYIASLDPDGALRDIQAKRRIMDWAHRMDPFPGMGGILAGEARKILKWLALPYADHPDYRPEWKP